ncbi:MAG: hypothetical protein JEY91_16640, partial [Spirochaetaceae bacterium]|nr:hypothetical protein [Spirochaetaceae bacterium]
MMKILELLTIKKSLTINNSSPLSVEDEKGLYIVESGMLYLFAVTQLKGGLIGARYQIASFEPGDIFFTLDSSDKETFIFIGTQNTRVSQIDSKSFFLGYQDHSQLFDGLLSRWINKICSNLLRGIHIPKIGVALEKDGIYQPDVSLFSHLLHWVKADENIVGFNDHSLQEWAQDKWFPVTGKQVVFLKEEQTLKIKTTASLIGKTGATPPSLST